MGVEEFSKEERVQIPFHHIDPGFINHRMIFGVLGPEAIERFQRNKRGGGDHLDNLFNDHLLVTELLLACKASKIKTLGEVLNEPAEGDIFASTEEFLPNEGVYAEERATSSIYFPFPTDWEVRVDYGTNKIVADTGKLELSQGGRITIVGRVRSIEGNLITAYPIVMGAPSFDHFYNGDMGRKLLFSGWDWYEIFPRDIDEFQRVQEEDDPSPEEWQDFMQRTSEEEVKKSLCQILGEEPKKDWGGELNDHFSANVHLAGERSTAAFLLKGPSDFREMVPAHLGKNADQIFRLAQSPAQVLIVQHSHNIGEAVRAELRAFSVNPSNPRRYCFIDGKDTYKILALLEFVWVAFPDQPALGTLNA